MKFWETKMNLDRDFLIIGKFMFSIHRGYFDRTSGMYEINILSTQKAYLMCQNDIVKLFNIK